MNGPKIKIIPELQSRFALSIYSYVRTSRLRELYMLELHQPTIDIIPPTVARFLRCCCFHSNLLIVSSDDDLLLALELGHQAL